MTGKTTHCYRIVQTHKIFFFLLLFAYVLLSAPLQLEYNTTLSEGTEITLPLGGSVDVIVDWGDGSSDTITSADDHKHTYAEEGTYRVSVSGNLSQLGNVFSDHSNMEKLQRVLDFGTLQLTSLAHAFYKATNLVAVPEELPSSVTSLSYTFAFNKQVEIEGLDKWDVSNVRSLFMTFSFAKQFNQDISSWDVSSVTTMRGLFSNAECFNQNINRWDVSSVTDMTQLFLCASSFNQELNRWDVSKVTSFESMFYSAESFNQELDNWDVSSATNMKAMFLNAKAFNQYIGDWDVSKVTTMSMMFAGATIFSQRLKRWDVSRVTDMGHMFSGATVFNQSLGDWDVSSVTNMRSMFSGATAFNQNIESWDVSRVMDMSFLFNGATQFNFPLNNWDVRSVQIMNAMFQRAESFNQPLDKWDVDSVVDMSYMFHSASSFDQKLSTWDIRNVTRMNGMFMDVTLSPANYDALLTAWAKLPVQSDVVFHGGKSVYKGDDAADARTKLKEQFNWTIVDKGRYTLPYIGIVWPCTIPEDSSLTIVKEMSDAHQGHGDTLIMLVAPGENYTVSGTTVTPDTNWFGELAVPVRVTNLIDTTDAVTMKLTVSSVNDLPVITSKPNKSARIGDEWRYVVSATDVESESLQYGLTAAPEGMTISGDTIRWTPDSGKYTTDTIVVTAMDDDSGITEQKFSLEVLGLNRPPVLTTVDPMRIKKGEYAVVTLDQTDAYDPDGDSLSLIIEERSLYTVVGDTIIPNANIAGGTGLFKVWVSDGEYKSDYAMLWLTIDPAVSIIEKDDSSKSSALLVYPNPAPHSGEKVTVSIPRQVVGECRISICDMLGNELDYATVTAGGGGLYEWDLCNRQGQKVAAGSYVVHISYTDADGAAKVLKKVFGVRK